MESSRPLLAAMLLGLATSWPAEAAPPEKTTSRFRGLEGYATLSFQVDDCRTGYFDLYAIEELTSTGPGGPTSTRYVAAFYSSYDSCTDRYGYGHGWDEGAAVRGSGVSQLSAQAVVPIEGCTYGAPDWVPVCSELTLIVDLDWRTNGEMASHGQTTLHTSTPFWTVHRRSVGSHATADVSGVLLLEGMSVLEHALWSAGGLSKTREGSIEFMRY